MINPVWSGLSWCGPSNKELKQQHCKSLFAPELHLLANRISYCVFICLCPLQYSKHLFVHIGQTNPSYSDPLLEAVDIRQIYDKFPEKKGGLKELYEKGPQNAFFLVKFWVGHHQHHQYHLPVHCCYCAFHFWFMSWRYVKGGGHLIYNM